MKLSKLARFGVLLFMLMGFCLLLCDTMSFANSHIGKIFQAPHKLWQQGLSYPLRIWPLLGGFAKLHKGVISFIISFCPSVYMEQFGYHCTDFCYNFIYKY